MCGFNEICSNCRHDAIKIFSSSIIIRSSISHMRACTGEVTFSWGSCMQLFDILVTCHVLHVGGEAQWWEHHNQLAICEFSCVMASTAQGLFARTRPGCELCLLWVFDSNKALNKSCKINIKLNFYRCSIRCRSLIVCFGNTQSLFHV